jgi:hypothetical protein
MIIAKIIVMAIFHAFMDLEKAISYHHHIQIITNCLILQGVQ